MLAAMGAAKHRQIDQLARRQLGLASTHQLEELGFGRRSRARAVASGRLVRFRRGVYLMAGRQPTWETAVMAAVLAAGTPTVASHLTAARVWGLEPDRQAGPPGAIHLTAPSDIRIAGVVAHVRDLPPAHRVRRGAIPVTSVARTLIDLSECFDAERLGRCTDEALRRRMVTLDGLRRLYAVSRGPGRRRLAAIRQVLNERIPGFDPGANDWERAMDDLWDSLELPTAARQHEIRCGNRTYRVDRAIIELRLAVEWVGTEYHGQVGRFRRDRKRISDLALAGWDVIEVTADWTAERVKRTVIAKAAERRRLLAAS
jgi:very-short-patch-repair endonuclease